MALQTFPYAFHMIGNTCTDKLCTATTIHLLQQSDLYMLVTTKDLFVATIRAQVNSSKL